MAFKKYEHPPEPGSAEIKNALSALNSRLHRSKQYDEYVALVEKLFQDKVTEGMKSTARNEAKRAAKIEASRLYRVPLAQLDVLELPLWGYEIPSHNNAKALREASSALLGSDLEEIEEAVKSNPLLEGLKDSMMEERWLEQLWLRVPAEKEADAKSVVSWVISHLKVSMENIEPSMIPSRAALAVLDDCRKDDDFRRDFLKKWMDKFLPSKQQVEYEQRYADDGRQKFGMVERCLASLEDEGSEDGE